jgi:hypothetical protein
MPIFQHGKNSRVLISNPSYISSTIQAHWGNSSSTVTVDSTGTPLYVGMSVAATSAGLPASTITAVSFSLTGATLTVSGTTTVAATSPTPVTLSAPSGFTADMSQFFNDISVTRSAEASETTTFQNNGNKTFIQGLREGAISLTGLYEGTIQGTDPFFNSLIEKGGDDAVLIFPHGGTATVLGGSDHRCQMAQGIDTKYDLKSPVAGVITAGMDITADGGVWNGVGQYIPSTVLTGASTYYTSASQFGSISTTKGGQLQMGVISLNGTTPTISLQLQHSLTGGSWVNVGSALTSVGTSIQILSGSIYPYTRLAVTLGGTSPSATVYYGFARY